MTRYALRPELGSGTIETTSLSTGLQLLRYDVQFAQDHRVNYSFTEERFELEVCLEGKMRISETQAGQGELGSNAVSFTPQRATSGEIVHPAGERYRAVSLAGNIDGLAPYLGSIDPSCFAQAISALSSLHGSELYLGSPKHLRGLPAVFTELYGLRAETPGKTLMLEARVMAALALLIEAGEQANSGAQAKEQRALAQHEIDAIRNLPNVMWQLRHQAPTVHTLSKMISMSPKRLSSGFKTMFGVTPMEYHRQRCLDQACNLLLETNHTVEHIAFELGYATASNFVYAFRKRRGCTPAQYRRDLG